MKTYSFSPHGISKIRQRFLQRMSIFLGVLCCIMIMVSLWQASENWLIALIVSIILSIGIMTFGLRRLLQQNKEIWESTQIELTDDYIGRSQARVPQMRINRQEITSIEEMDGGLCIRTADKLRTLVIPNDLDENDFHEIKNKLTSWKDIQPKSPKAKTQNIALLILLLIGFGILMFSSSLWVVLITGILITGYCGYAYFSLRNAEGIDPQFKRSMLFAFLFPIFLTMMKVFVLSSIFESWIRFLTQPR